MPQHPWVVTANALLANELCDEQRFIKKDLPFRAVRQVVPTSIFAVSTTEPVWAKAHRTLLPLFSTRALQSYLDYTEIPVERERLRSLIGSDEESKERYRREILEQHVTLLDLVEMYPSCDVPAAILLELLPPLRPRYYSISSSPTLPIIMVGAGTGLAPFMGFLQERAALQSEGKRVGPSLLFFGCRHPEQDFLYQDELESYVEQGLTQLHVSFSRAEVQPKAYVQDKILEQQDLVWHFIEQGAPTFICGDMEKMVPGVAQAYRTLYQRVRGTSARQAAHWLEEMTAQHRYVVDIWGAPGSF